MPKLCACAHINDDTGCLPVEYFRSSDYFNNHGWNLSVEFGYNSMSINRYLHLTQVPTPDLQIFKFPIITEENSLWYPYHWRIFSSGLPYIAMNYSFICTLEGGATEVSCILKPFRTTPAGPVLQNARALSSRVSTVVNGTAEHVTWEIASALVATPARTARFNHVEIVGRLSTAYAFVT